MSACRRAQWISAVSCSPTAGATARPSPPGSSSSSWTISPAAFRALATLQLDRSPARRSTWCGALASWLSKTSVNGLSAAVVNLGVSNFVALVATTVTTAPDAAGPPEADAAGAPEADPDGATAPDAAAEADGRGAVDGA